MSENLQFRPTYIIDVAVCVDIVTDNESVYTHYNNIFLPLCRI